jgi:hypothetical protein
MASDAKLVGALAIGAHRVYRDELVQPGVKGETTDECGVSL